MPNGRNEGIDHDFVPSARGYAELGRLATTELDGVVEGLRLLGYGAGWATFSAREQCCGARILVRLRARGLDDIVLDDVLRAARRGRDTPWPSVLPVRRFGCTDRLVWWTMHEKGGYLLDHWFGEHQAPSEVAAMRFLRMVAAPLHDTHAQHGVHGAVTPSAFHRDAEGTVRVCAPGVELPMLLADLVEGAETEATACASPEVRAGDSPTAASDQWAVAAVLVRLLTGRGVGAHGELPSELPDDWARALARALAPIPEDRFGSVRALWHALDPGTPGEDVGLADAPTGARARRGRSPDPIERGADAAYVPSAFRPRRSPARRLAMPIRDLDPAEIDQVLFPDEGFGAVPALGDPTGRVTPFRRFVGALLLLVLGAALWHSYAANPDEPLSEVVAAAGLASEWWVDRWRGPTTSPAPTPPAEGAYGIDLPELGQRGGASERLAPGSTLAEERAQPEGPPREDAPEERAPSRISAGSDESSGSGGTEPRDPPSAPARRPASALPSGRGAADRLPIAPLVEFLPPGTISVQSFPWGTVYIDDVPVGTTPVVDLPVAAGLHVVRVERPDYEPYVRTVRIESAENLRLAGIALRTGGR